MPRLSQLRTFELRLTQLHLPPSEAEAVLNTRLTLPCKRANYVTF